MNLRLDRIAYRGHYTIGKLFVDGVYFCDTLEDTEREVKIAGETCIPKGEYDVIINHSNRFKRQMPLLLNVPNFTGIRIHSGNNDKHTEGCILVGNNSEVGKLTDSKKTFDLLFDRLIKSTTPIKISIE